MSATTLDQASLLAWIDNTPITPNVVKALYGAMDPEPLAYALARPGAPSLGSVLPNAFELMGLVRAQPHQRAAMLALVIEAYAQEPSAFRTASRDVSHLVANILACDDGALWDQAVDGFKLPSMPRYGLASIVGHGTPSFTPDQQRILCAIARSLKGHPELPRAAEDMAEAWTDWYQAHVIALLIRDAGFYQRYHVYGGDAGWQDRLTVRTQSAHGLLSLRTSLEALPQGVALFSVSKASVERALAGSEHA